MKAIGDFSPSMDNAERDGNGCLLVRVWLAMGLAALGADQVLAQIEGPFVSATVIPTAADIDLRSLPLADPWQPGDPIFCRSAPAQLCAE